jgi:hypothetical protein
MNFQLRVWYALTDIEDMDFLIEILPESNAIEQVTGSILVLLSVDAVAFSPRITIDENGKVEGLGDLHNSRLQIFLANLFSMHAPFRDFVMEHFEQAYSLLFVYQVQPVTPSLTCCLIHATAAMNGRGNESMIAALQAIATQLRAHSQYSDMPSMATRVSIACMTTFKMHGKNSSHLYCWILFSGHKC